MFNRIHQKLGTAGFIISIVALVAALGGGAYAASGGLSGKQKKEVEKIAKKYAGKPGAAGATGPAGTPGAKGAPGADGTNGTNGTAGTNGTNGAAGTSVTNTALAKGSTTCPEGGAEFKVGTGAATHACNGVTGFTSTLPTGKTETGAWSIDVASSSALASFTTISFPIPLAEEGPEGSAFVFNQAETEGEEFGKNETTGASCVVGEPECEDTGCGGTVSEPTAAEGVLCVYTQFESGVTGIIESRSFGGAFESYGTTGASLNGPGLVGSAGSEVHVERVGTWAITAPVPAP